MRLMEAFAILQQAMADHSMKPRNDTSHRPISPQCDSVREDGNGPGRSNSRRQQTQQTIAWKYSTVLKPYDLRFTVCMIQLMTPAVPSVVPTSRQTPACRQNVETIDGNQPNSTLLKWFDRPRALV
jgi:hypothetical protein